MLEEWPWLTPEQSADLVRLSNRLARDAEETNVALGRLSARAVRFAVDNSRALVVLVAPPDWGSAQIDAAAESLVQLDHEALVVPHGTEVHVIGRETITPAELERLRAAAAPLYPPCSDGSPVHDLEGKATCPRCGYTPKVAAP
jgi:hypothetical protein